MQLLKGSGQIYGTLRRSVSAARKEVLAFTTTKGIARSYRQGINEAVLQALGRAVAARLIVDIRADNSVLFRRVADRVPVRHVEGQRGRFIITDREAVIAFLTQDERGLRGEGETALWTNSPDFVRMNVEFFDLAWRSGTPAGDRLRLFLGSRGASAH